MREFIAFRLSRLRLNLIKLVINDKNDNIAVPNAPYYLKYNLL